MPIVVTREPELISFSKNPIIYGLQSDARVDNPGAAAVNHIQLSGVITDGTVVVIRYKGEEQRMVARNVIQNAGFEFPAGTVSTGYLATILPYFRDNYYLDRDFIIDAVQDAHFNLRFTAREPGTAYNFLIQNIPTVQVVVKTAGIDRKIKPNFAIHAQLWIERPDGSTFEKIFAESLQVDESGNTEWNLSDLLHPELSPDIHDWETRTFEIDINSKRRYYIRYAEAWGDKFQIGKITKADEKHVTLGGTPYESGSNLTVLDLLRESDNVAKDKALRLGPDIRYVFPDEPQFLSFLNTRGFYNLSLEVKAKFAIGGESPLLTVSLGGVLGINKRATVNVGYEQLNINEIIAGNAVESYTVQFFSDNSPVSRPYTYVLKYEYKPYRRYFVYINSLGALDTMHVWGKNSQEIELVKRTAEKYLSPDYKFTDGTFVDWDIQYRQKFEAATGYRHAHEIRSFRDFYISRYKYRKFQNKALPILISSSSVKEYEDGDSLLAQTFDYSYAFEDDTWSEQEDSADLYAPPPGFQGAAGAPIVISVPPYPGIGSNGTLLYDIIPTSGSKNLVKSGSLFLEFLKKQNKLPLGLLGQYLRGNQTLGNFFDDVKGIVDNTLPAWKEDEFPNWVNDPSTSGRLSAGEPLDNVGGGGGGKQSGLYYTPTTSKEAGWPVDGLQGTLIRVVNGTPGSQVGSDIVTTSDGKTYIRTVNEVSGNSAYTEIGSNAVHPEFTAIPAIIVQTGVPFTKYVDLAIYKTSYHTLNNLIVDVEYNSLKFDGVEVSSEGLLIKVVGQIDKKFAANDRILIGIKDQHGNQKIVALKLESLEEPEEPDNRELCPRGPNHYLQAPIIIINNGELDIPYDGMGVIKSAWKLVRNPSDVTPIAASDPVNGHSPNGNHLIIEFPPQPGGKYYVGIQGFTCKSPWDFREVNLPADTTLEWAVGYPKYEGGVFKFKIKQNGQFLTEIYNATTNVKLFSELKDYVANTTEIVVPRTGGWPDAYYRINVGTLTANATVGVPPDPVSFTMALKTGWDGATIADLTAGNYDGPLPPGFNIFLESANVGFQYDFATIVLDLDVLGTWTQIASQGFSVGTGYRTNLPAWRLFPDAGVDSRFKNYNGSPINRYGKFRFTATFRSGGGESGEVVSTKQSFFSFNLLEVTGGIKGLGGASTPYSPVLGRVLLNKANVVNDNAWAYPFVYPNTLEFNLNGGSTWYKTSAWYNDTGLNDTSNVWLLNTASDGGIDLFPQGQTREVRLRMVANHNIVSAPINITNGAVVGSSLLGSYQTLVSNRLYTYSRNVRASLAFNGDGTISDNTPGLLQGAGVSTMPNGRKRYYNRGYSLIANTNSDGSKSYIPLQNLYFPDGIHSIRTVDVDASVAPNLAAYVAKIHGWGGGVTMLTADLAEINLSITTVGAPTNAASWVRISRHQLFPFNPVNRTADGSFATFQINTGDTAAAYHAIGINTETNIGLDEAQPLTFRTWKWPVDGTQPSAEDLYNYGAYLANKFKFNRYTVVTDEFPENTQGTDPNIESKMHHFYQACLDFIRILDPGVAVKNTWLMGSYGIDMFTKLLDVSILGGSRSVYIESLSTKLYNRLNPSTGEWGTTCKFLLDGDNDCRNINFDFYMSHGLRKIVSEVVYLNERVKKMTKTYGGVDKEKKWCVFMMPQSQSLVQDNFGNAIGLEYSRAAEIIQFPNGELIVYHTSPSVFDEFFKLGIISKFLKGGCHIWNGNGNVGTDPTKLSIAAPMQTARWRPTGGSEEDFVSGQNGAPVTDITGISAGLDPNAVDAAYAGMALVNSLGNRNETIYHASYTSSRGSLTATPGTAGLHLNGFGPVNNNLYVNKDAFDAKVGLPLVGVGPDGKVAMYCNDHLSAHEKEENVVVVHGGESVNLGTVYGQQIVFKKF